MSNPERATDIRFSSPDGLPADYKDLLIRMLSIQSRIESEYMLAPERTLHQAAHDGSHSRRQGRVCSVLVR